MGQYRRSARAAAWGLPAVLLVALAVAGGVAEAAEEIPEEWMSPFRYDSKGLRDPFVPLVRDGRLVGVEAGRRVNAARPVLYGVLWDPSGRSIALINDEEVQVGEQIAGYQLMEIREDAVVLKNGDEPVVLRISFEIPSDTASPGATTGGTLQ